MDGKEEEVREEKVATAREAPRREEEGGVKSLFLFVKIHLFVIG